MERLHPIAREARMQRRLRAFRAAVRAGRIGERTLTAVLGWPAPWFYEATAWLIGERRLAPAVRLLRARPPLPRFAAVHALQLVPALIGRGDLDAARAAVAALPAHTPDARELRTVLAGRLALAAGDPQSLLTLAPDPEPGAHPSWRIHRLALRADALASRGPYR